eukprot:CAMPEP_0118829246 /NCGR_PEP_ID=MMETSP1162-20130426/22584_1 /TAXON_ID=33656 /ORGANISM="Phaeocystis Sp, Strain CCMP2710" /LENGTH=198 /DNA_ID=CAMNT_0006760389 /DNA_START=77 /DNA_END=672 /DNA_ORIENTATION=+
MHKAQTRRSDQGGDDPGTGASLCEDGGAVREAMAATVEATLDFVDLVEVEVVVAKLLALQGLRAGIDLHCLRKLVVRLQTARLIAVVFEDDVRLLVLELTQAKQDYVSHSNPDALAQLPSDVAQSVDAIKAKRLKPTVPQHSRHLRVLLTILLEGQLTLGLESFFPLRRFLPPLPLLFTIGSAAHRWVAAAGRLPARL